MKKRILESGELEESTSAKASGGMAAWEDIEASGVLLTEDSGLLSLLNKVADDGNTSVESMAEHFRDHSRFRLLNRLGQGGYGQVYAADDLFQGQRVALKILGRQDPRAIYQLKREFRLLRGCLHPHLLPFFELFVEEGVHYFTMKLLEGQSLQRWIADFEGPFNHDRRLTVGRLLSQVAGALDYLHQEGLLHRDLKPSNIMVCPPVGAILLDFGLAEAREASSPRDIAGTPAYMSPEQWVGVGVGTPSDWYAFGVVLFELLVGQRPGQNASYEHLKGCLSRAGDIPETWISLCLSLLEPSPEQRPNYEQIAQVFPFEGQQLSEGFRALKTTFAGRRQELRALHECYEGRRRSQARLALIVGAEGVGKTALLGQFSNEVKAKEQGAIVLSAACYSQESLLYNVLDGWVDDLAAYLAKLTAEERNILLPADLFALNQLFPVMGQFLPSSAVLQQSEERVVGMRARAFAALKDTFFRLSQRSSLLLQIDGLELCDLESAECIQQLLNVPQLPCFLLGTARGPGVEGPLAELFKPKALSEDELINLDVLKADEAKVLSPTTMLDEAAYHQIVCLCEGNLRFVLALVSLIPHLVTEQSLSPKQALSRLKSDILASLSANALKALSWSLLVESPLHGEPLMAASGARPEELQSLISLQLLEPLDGQRFRARLGPEIVCPPSEVEAVDIYQRLAQALLDWGKGEDEEIGRFLLLSKQVERAVFHYREAAEQASLAYAFERSIRLLEHIQGLPELPVEMAHENSRLMAEALARAGRGQQAVDAFEQLLKQCDGGTQVSLYRQRMAEELIKCGKIEQGVALASLSVNGSGERALLWKGRWCRWTLILKVFLGLNLGQPAQRSVTDRKRALELWPASVCLLSVNAQEAKSYLSAFTRASFRSGDRELLFRSLAIEAMRLNFAFLPSFFQRALAERAGEVWRSLSLEEQNSSSILPLRWAQLSALLLTGAVQEALRLISYTEQRLLNSADTRNHVLTNIRRVELVCLTFTNDYEQLRLCFERCMVEYKETGDLFNQGVAIRSGGWLVYLVDDKPEKAMEALAWAEGVEGEKYLSMRMVQGLLARVRICCYQGKFDEGLSFVETKRQVLKKGPKHVRFSMGRFLDLVTLLLRVKRCLVAEEEGEGAPSSWTLIKMKHRAKVMLLGPLPVYGVLQIYGILARIERLRGRKFQSVAWLKKGQRLALSFQLHGHAAAFLYYRGLWVGGELGQINRVSALDFFQNRSVVSPEKMIQSLL